MIGENSKILFNRDPAERVEAVAPWLTTDTSVYPAIVNKRMVWIVDGYTTLDNYPYSELTTLSSATADSNEVAVNRLAPDKQVSYIRNSVKATVDAYDGTGDAVRPGRTGSGAQGLDEACSRAPSSPKADISPELQAPPALPGGPVQGAALAADQVPRRRSGEVLHQLRFLECAAGSQPRPRAAISRRTTSCARDLANNDNSASFQLTSALNWLQREFLAAYISASSDPSSYGKITVLTIPGEVKGPKQAFNAISTDTAVTQDLGVIGRDNLNRIRWGNLLTLPVADGGLLYVAPVYASPGTSDAASTYPRSDPGGDALQGQGRLRPDGR